MDPKLYLRRDFKYYKSPFGQSVVPSSEFFLAAFPRLGVKPRLTMQKRSFLSSARDFTDPERGLCKMLISLKRQELTKPYREKRVL